MANTEYEDYEPNYDSCPCGCGGIGCCVARCDELEPDELVELAADQMVKVFLRSLTEETKHNGKH